MNIYVVFIKQTITAIVIVSIQKSHWLQQT
jgi:hypothetical protein